MIDVYFILTLMSIAVLVAVTVVMFNMKRQARLKRQADGANASAATTQTDAGYSEPETRFLESARRSQYRLLNTSEQALYHRLREAMPSMTILCHVGLAQLVQLRGQHAVAEIGDLVGRCVNFVVCRDDFSIVAAIDLVWPGEEGPERQKATENKRLALQKLEIPWLVYRPQQLPNVDTIEREIAAAVLRQSRL
jgi:hypothetical protein